MDTDLSRKTWGMHLNQSIWFSGMPIVPDWVPPAQKEKWHKRGFVLWDENTQVITNLFASQALDVLEAMQETDTWKTEGLWVGSPTVRISLPNIKRPKKKGQDEAEEIKETPRGEWILSDKIQLSPEQTQEFWSFLVHHKNMLEKIRAEEETERSRNLAKAYSILLRAARRKRDSEMEETPEVE